MRSIVNDPKVTSAYRRRYFIEDGIIKPDLSSKVQEYAPFEYYDAKQQRKTESPHLEFASVDYTDMEQIVAFCSKWGLLGVSERDFIMVRPQSEEYGMPEKLAINLRNRVYIANGVDLTEYHKEHTEWEPVRNFQYFCEQFQFMVRIKDALFPLDIGKIKALQERYSKKWPADVPKININSADIDYIIEGLTYVLSRMINREIQRSISIIPNIFLNDGSNTVMKGDSPKQDISLKCEANWGFVGLITGMYLMLFLDLQNGVFTKQCPKCARWFVSTIEGSTYCTPEHQEAAKSARNYEKYKEQINLKRRKRKD